MAFLLLFQTLLERVHELVPRAHLLDLRHFLFGEVFLGDRLQPVFGDVDLFLAVVGHDALEDLGEHLIEAVQQAFVLHEGRAGEVVERLGRLLDHILIERLKQRQVLLEAGGNARRAQFVDEIEKHWRPLLPLPPCLG